MSDEILEYIKKHVKKWPESAENVRLDKDGEICFMGDVYDTDFHPCEKFKGVFIPDEEFSECGRLYTREEWEQDLTDLTKLDKPFGELDRATQLKLVEHVLDGGRVERCDPQFTAGFKKLRRDGLWFVNFLKYRAI